MALVRRSSLVEMVALEEWSIATSEADRPEELGHQVDWLSIPGPTTVAAALLGHHLWDFDRKRAFDEETWWFRCRARRLSRQEGTRNTLHMGGLATLADVFVDGRHVLRSENMFHSHVLDLDEATSSSEPGLGRSPPSTGDVKAHHEILFRFAPVSAALATKRSRPRWKTRLASHQQLRWIRTSLVGRMPGWSPPVPPIGLWRGVALERASRFVVDDASVRARVESGQGIVNVDLRLVCLGPSRLAHATLIVGDHVESLRVSAREGDVVGMRGELRVAKPKIWWPHTHGDQERYRARIRLDDGAEIDLGSIAFRTIQLDTSSKGFAIRVNDVPVFCRGACWTTTDITTLVNEHHPSEYVRILRLVREAGMNMVRLSGTMFYEDDAFYDACDELGILVWQDFAFANMDYPIGDEAFRASVIREANELLARLETHPSLAVLCGGSEVEQQAAMFGAARAVWRGPLFDEVLPAACASRCPDVPYWPNSPSGGALPFHVDEGVGHYYGVGAYLRPFDDVRRSRVRFASECLAFANVPEDDLLPVFLAEGEAPFVHARWKERTSKDHGSGWDFEDVRDHYLGRLFGVDPMRVRYEDMERYLLLSRVTSGEVMARAMAEFRRGDSTCRGALVWFLQDLWPGAGWGILDSRGQPKAAYWFLKRALRSLSLSITDEGVNGLHIHVINDRSRDVGALLRFALFRDGEVRTAQGTSDIAVQAHSAMEVAADALLETFADASRAYRFGPPGHDLAIASLIDPESGATLAETFHLLDFASPPPCVGLEAILYRSDSPALPREPKDLVVAVRAKRFAHAVALSVPGYVPDDNYFDLPPGAERRITLRPICESKRTPAGTLSALNLRTPISLILSEASATGG